MEVLIILVPVSLGLSILALGAFLWTLRHSQYDDLDGDAWRILLDDDQQLSDPITGEPDQEGRKKPGKPGSAK